MNQAVRYDPMSSIRYSWCADMPFLLEHIRNKAASHLLREILESSKMVPTVAENCLRQVRHL